MLTKMLAMAVAIGLVSTPGAAGRRGPRPRGERYCSATAAAAYDACQKESQGDYAIAVGVCTNVTDDAERAGCLAAAKAARREEDELCHEQRAARRDVCDALGEARYDPAFDPAAFDDDFDDLTHPNPYFPLAPGHRWEYRGGTESIEVEVTDETKLVQGVTCIVVRDRVTDDGDLVEDTDDWFAHAQNGDVYYCGEEVKDFESFDGDDPRRPELVSIDGSFKAGRNGAKPGIRFPGAPTPGRVYRQEFSLGTAEDVAQVLSSTYGFGNDPELDRLVPRTLAELLCAGDCVVTKDFSPLEPDAVERKYHAPGIGTFLEVNLDDGTAVQLVACNVDPRCAMLPAPE